MTIYYVSPDFWGPAGGVQVMYRHVDILNRAGLPAYVLHTNPPFRCTWFENDTPIRYLFDRPSVLPLREVVKRVSRGATENLGELPRSALRSLTDKAGWRAKPTLSLDDGDVLAITELIWLGGFDLFPGAPRVVFNQGAYLTFGQWRADSDPYARADVLGVMTVSADSEAYLKMAFGSHGFPIVRVHETVSPVFSVSDEPKEKLIAYMPRRNADHAHQVLSLLSLRGSLNDWTIIKIDDVTQEEVASILRRAAVFLSFGHLEGFGLPAAEAMGCGCVVVGYHGMGGREFFLSEFSFPIGYGEIRAYVDAVEEAMRQYEREPEQFRARGLAAADFVRTTYSPERESREVVHAWTTFLELMRRARGKTTDGQYV